MEVHGFKGAGGFAQLKVELTQSMADPQVRAGLCVRGHAMPKRRSDLFDACLLHGIAGSTVSEVARQCVLVLFVVTAKSQVLLRPLL